MGFLTRNNRARVLTKVELRQIKKHGPGCSRSECSYGNYHFRARNNKPCLRCQSLDWEDCSSRPRPKEEIDAQNAQLDQVENHKTCKAQNKEMRQKAKKESELGKQNSGSAYKKSADYHLQDVSHGQTCWSGSPEMAERERLEAMKRRGEEKPYVAELEGSRLSGETARGPSCEQTRLSFNQPPSSAPTMKELPALPIDQHITKPKPVYLPYRIGDSNRLPGICEDPAFNVPRHRLSTETHRAINELCPPKLSTNFNVSYPGVPQLPPRVLAAKDDRSRLPGSQPRSQQQIRRKRVPSHAQNKPLPKSPTTGAESDKTRRKSNRNSSILPDAEGRPCISRGSGEYERLELPQEVQNDDNEFKIDTLNRSAYGAQVRVCRP
ncbi:hypothetical protein LIA77_01524 [Sarocladium implicatum]|nr:hypothetical protein LIA77_01524 [Sarocladium implicatum]